MVYYLMMLGYRFICMFFIKIVYWRDCNIFNGLVIIILVIKVGVIFFLICIMDIFFEV